MWRAPGAVRALSLALALTAAGCSNPFLPAQPEAPASGQESVTVPMDFSTPELVLGTLAAAVSVKDRGNGATAYLAAFADTLTQGVGVRFDFDPDVVAERAGVGKYGPAGGWTVDPNEKTFYKNLSALRTGEFALTWTDTLTEEAPDPDRRVLYRQYAVTATDEDFSSTDYISRGWVRIEMLQIPGPPARWVITRWTDHILDAETGPDPADAGLRCFSRLRIDSYNGIR